MSELFYGISDDRKKKIARGGCDPNTTPRECEQGGGQNLRWRKGRKNIERARRKMASKA